MRATFEDGHLSPVGLVAKGLGDPLLAIHIGLIVRQQHVLILVEKGIDNRFKQARLPWIEVIRNERINYLFQHWVAVVVLAGIVALGFEAHHLLSCQTKEKEVLCPHFLANFHIRAISVPMVSAPLRANFHIAGAGGLFPSGGDLLRKIGSGIDHLSKRNRVVAQEYHLETAIYITVVVDHITYGINQLDDHFGHEIARGCLAAKNKRARLNVHVGIGFDLLVERNDVEHR